MKHLPRSSAYLVHDETKSFGSIPSTHPVHDETNHFGNIVFTFIKHVKFQKPNFIIRPQNSKLWPF